MSESGPHFANRLVQIRKLVRFAMDRGFAKFSDLDLTGDRFSTSGVLLGAKGTRDASRFFATLTDGRDHIQLVLTPGLSGISQEHLASLQRGAKFSVTGVPFLSGRNAETALPSLYVVDVNSSSSPAPVKFEEDALRSEVTPRLVIGRLMAFVSGQLELNEYVRYEPQFITSSKVDLDTEPLMVRFPGRGADLFLEVSPLPQLLYAAVMTGEKKIYSPTRLFSRAYRDGFTSVDSPIVAAVEVELGEDRKTSLEQVARSLISGFTRAQDSGLPSDLLPDIEIDITNQPTSPMTGDVIKIRLRDLPSPLTTTYAYDIRRHITVETPTGHVIIEGHEGLIAQAIPYHWLCVHIERLVLGDLWRIKQRRGLQEGSRP